MLKVLLMHTSDLTSGVTFFLILNCTISGGIRLPSLWIYPNVLCDVRFIEFFFFFTLLLCYTIECDLTGWTQQLSVFPTTCSFHLRTPCNSFNSILFTQVFADLWSNIVYMPWLHWFHIWHCGWLFRQRPHSLSCQWRLCAEWQASCISERSQNGGTGKIFSFCKSTSFIAWILFFVFFAFACSWPYITMMEALVTDVFTQYPHPQTQWQIVLMEEC